MTSLSASSLINRLTSVTLPFIFLEIALRSSKIFSEVSAKLLSILFLSIQKLLFQGSGFLNPYSYLSSMLLVIFGFQCVVYGSFARLILQLRRDVTVIRTVSPHAKIEGAGNVFKEKGQ